MQQSCAFLLLLQLPQSSVFLNGGKKGKQMIIGLHDADRSQFKHKIFPNYALMKISAWHKQQRDIVEWWNPLYRYDKVYSSKIFDFTPEDPYLPDDATRGGTGYRDIPMRRELPEEVDRMFPDYSIYPECDYADRLHNKGMPKSLQMVRSSKKRGADKAVQIMERIGST